MITDLQFSLLLKNNTINKIKKV